MNKRYCEHRGIFLKETTKEILVKKNDFLAFLDH